ncbi:MAG TPA: transcriptional regulator [Candidatus Rifleibacterium sp.]|nr:transcriptional regulator [Candidatus Rifleibacterium sp.]
MSSIVNSTISGTEIQSAWLELTRNIPLSRIHSKKQYRLVVSVMEYFADLVNDDAKHPLAGLLEVLEVLVEDYDREHHQMPAISGVDFLKNLMREQGLGQSDLSELGSQGVVSEILAGKRRLNRRHAELLAKRFSLPEELFTRN